MEKTLRELFGEVINEKAIHHELEMNESTVRSLRKKFNEGTSISDEKMREVLSKAGYHCVVEERWGR